MSTNKQTTKNIKLSHKLTMYLIKHPAVSKKLPFDASFVVYTKDDDELNKANDLLLQELIEEGKPVVKAKETNDKNNPWAFSSIS
ncbi:hypothetical protein KKE68_02520, partial [Patescibacteria group bacterium]|nr:hypothetical protein [Patescibacteria group bacterium]